MFWLFPRLAQHLLLGQLPGDIAGQHQAQDHSTDHDVVKVLLQQVESLAGGDPGTVQVQPVDEHKGGGLEPRRRRDDAPRVCHELQPGKYSLNFKRINIILINKDDNI